jgi:hypothetical protein
MVNKSLAFRCSKGSLLARKREKGRKKERKREIEIESKRERYRRGLKVDNATNAVCVITLTSSSYAMMQ